MKKSYIPIESIEYESLKSEIMNYRNKHGLTMKEFDERVGDPAHTILSKLKERGYIAKKTYHNICVLLNVDDSYFIKCKKNRETKTYQIKAGLDQKIHEIAFLNRKSISDTVSEAFEEYIQRHSVEIPISKLLDYCRENHISSDVVQSVANAMEKTANNHKEI